MAFFADLLMVRVLQLSKMTGKLITLQAFTCGEMAFFHIGGWSRWESMIPLLGGLRGGIWEDACLVDTGSPDLVLGPFPGPTGVWG